MSINTLSGDGRVFLNEYRTYKELARVADQSAMDTNPEQDRVSFNLKGNVHVDVDFCTPTTVLTLTKGDQEYPSPLDNSHPISKPHYFTREKYEEKGNSVKVTWEHANTLQDDNTAYDVKDAKVNFYTDTREFTVNMKTGRITRQSVSDKNHWIIPDYQARQRDYSWHQ